jgi:hypothetical protein
VTQSYSSTETYSVADVEVVLKRVKADLIMIASSTGAVTEAKAADWAHDIEVLAKNGYLSAVDLTLLSNGVEQKATKFLVNTAAGDLTPSRPGGVMWPKVQNPELRIILFHTPKYTDTARASLAARLKIGWGPTSADTSHATLKANTGRDYVSNGYGMQRKDFTQ